MAPLRLLFSPSLLRFTQQTAQRRAYSVLPAIKSALRNVEPHPYERFPTKSAGAKPDWGKQVRKAGGSLLYFFPAAVVILFWPLAAEQLLDGHV